jgi:hypothetical protein
VNEANDNVGYCDFLKKETFGAKLTKMNGAFVASHTCANRTPVNKEASL